MLKRSVDICGAILGLVFLFPLFVITAIGIIFSNPGPIFFRQDRVGLNGDIFRIIKFRTMTHSATSAGCQVTSSNDQRITSFGGFLRRHKLDELPQLINVLLGHMSLVGPRPEVPRYVEQFPTEFAQLSNRKPGMTHRVSLLLRNEEVILSKSDDPEGTYVQEVLPWKLGLYLKDQETDSVVSDILTICQTVLGKQPANPISIPPFDSPLVANIPAFPDDVDNRNEFSPIHRKEISADFTRTGTE